MKRMLLLPFLVLALLGLSGCAASMPETPPEKLNTPRYDAISPDTTPLPTAPKVYTAEDGVVVIAPSSAEAPGAAAETEAEPASSPETPETVWEADDTVTYHAFTMPDKTLLDAESGCIGVLSIPAIELSLNVYEAEDSMEAMRHGAAHYKDTSAWDGNCGISAHNGGVPLEVSFANLHKLKKGDTVSYTTALGERSYTVTEIREIADDDWSWLARTADNRVTMTTCISGKPDKRLMVQAVQE